MKHTISLCLLSILFFGCSHKISLPLGYYKNGKNIGVVYDFEPLSLYKEGPQGILEAAITGRKYSEAIRVLDKKFNLKDELLPIIKDTFSSSGKELSVISPYFHPDSYKKFIKRESSEEKSYYKYDLASFKKNGIDELLIIEAQYGILSTFYGFIETKAEGLSNIEVHIINLEDNSILFRKKAKGKHEIPLIWDTPPEYMELILAIRTAMNTSLDVLKKSLTDSK